MWVDKREQKNYAVKSVHSFLIKADANNFKIALKWTWKSDLWKSELVPYLFFFFKTIREKMGIVPLRQWALSKVPSTLHDKGLLHSTYQLRFGREIGLTLLSQGSLASYTLIYLVWVSPSLWHHSWTIPTSTWSL